MRLTTNTDPRPDPHQTRNDPAPSCDVCTVQTKPHGTGWRCGNCGNVMRPEDAGKVARIKAALDAGEYDEGAGLGTAVDRMIAAHVPAYRHAGDPEPRAMTWADAYVIDKANAIGWRPLLTYPRLADDDGRDVDVPGQLFLPLLEDGQGGAA